MTTRKIKFSIGRKRLASTTVSAALDHIGNHFGVKKTDLTCEAAEPTRDPEHGWGRCIWVWHGDFAADTAASLWVPNLTYRVWASHNGACRLA